MPKTPGTRPAPRLAPVLALAFAAIAAAAARTASADMILTSDGKWYPLVAPDKDTPAPTLAADEMPTDEMLAASADYKVDAGYDTVKVKGPKPIERPTGQVLKVVSSERVTGGFRQALNDASSGFWKEAAEGFAGVAAGAVGLGKQEALYLRVEAVANIGGATVVADVNGAIDELLAAFPKTFYFATVHILRARLTPGKPDLVTKAMEAVKTAAGMNLRDAFRAEYMRIYLTLENAIDRKAADARVAYQRLVDAIEKSAAPAEAEVVRLKALIGIGNCLLAAGQTAEATTFLVRAIDSKNVDVLAGAYTSLGDVAFTEARNLRDQRKLDEAKKRLEDAALHYLRVSTFYATSPLFEEEDALNRALQNQAKVFAALFDMTKDVEQGKRAMSTYRELANRLGEGDPAKRQVVKDANDLNAKIKAAIDAAAPKQPEKPKEPAKPN